MAVELRNRLSETTGITLPATLAFDYPTPRAIAGFILAQIGETGAVQGVVRRSRSAGHGQGEEPIAIVSMACRLPGGIATPEEYCSLLDRGGDAIETFPSRWDGLDLYDPDPEAAGKS
jgi:hypothetical protein